MKQSYNYQEREALRVIRNAMLTKPEIAADLLRGMTKSHAYHLLKQAQIEIEQLHAVTRAIMHATQELLTLDQTGERE